MVIKTKKRVTKNITKNITNKQLKKDLLEEIFREFEIEKRIRERELYKNGATCVNGKCSLPVFFTFEEIENIIKKFE